jgi:hypothetical protein
MDGKGVGTDAKGVGMDRKGVGMDGKGVGMDGKGVVVGYGNGWHILSAALFRVLPRR